MSDLDELQRKFKQSVVSGTDVAFLSEIEEGGKINPDQRLYIYSHAYKARLTEVLQEDYEVLHTMVGDEVFALICNQYIDQYPSSHPSLSFFGQHMEQFLNEHVVYSDKKILAEMAHFEWNFSKIFNAADAPNITFEEIAAIPPEAWTTLRLQINPTTVMSEFNWNVPAVWASVTEENDEVVTPAEYPDKATCIQWRHELVCYFRTFDEDELAAFNYALKTKTFPEICECLSEFHGENAPMRAAELLKIWVSEGLISKIEFLSI